jgi:hypothetical protein
MAHVGAGESFLELVNSPHVAFCRLHSCERLLSEMTWELEHEEEILPEAMPAWICPACGINLREHTSEMIKECTRKVREKKLDRHAA